MHIHKYFLLIAIVSLTIGTLSGMSWNNNKSSWCYTKTHSTPCWRTTWKKPSLHSQIKETLRAANKNDIQFIKTLNLLLKLERQFTPLIKDRKNLLTTLESITYQNILYNLERNFLIRAMSLINILPKSKGGLFSIDNQTQKILEDYGTLFYSMQKIFINRKFNIANQFFTDTYKAIRMSVTKYNNLSNRINPNSRRFQLPSYTKKEREKFDAYQRWILLKKIHPLTTPPTQATPEIIDSSEEEDESSLWSLDLGDIPPPPCSPTTKTSPNRAFNNEELAERLRQFKQLN
ncbi:hypothetical protein KAU11_03260 [Candidatus Babeliales bacterium]|nr:hypothetical protein [Candidatus Babeliales bacterium]